MGAEELVNCVVFLLHRTPIRRLHRDLHRERDAQPPSLAQMLKTLPMRVASYIAIASALTLTLVAPPFTAEWRLRRAELFIYIYN